MKRFLTRLTLFTAACLFVSAGILFAEKKILDLKGKFVLPDRDKYIFLGHSHAQYGYNDALIDSSLNFASSGEAYFYTYIKLKRILESNPEKKTIFLEYSNNNITREMDDWTWGEEHLNGNYRLYSAYASWDEIKTLYSKNPGAAFVCDGKSIINNSYYLLRLKNLLSEKRMGGYFQLKRDKTDSLINSLEQANNMSYKDVGMSSPISETNIHYLEKIIALCKEHGTKIYLMRSPLHPNYQGFDNEERYKEILATRLAGTEYLDFKDFPLQNSEFGDLQHINYRGARRYSMFINRLLKEGLLEKKNKQAFINEEINREKNDASVNYGISTASDF